jgi:uncharacterized protein YcbK (DUF882 family)
VLDSDGKFPDRRKVATQAQRDNAAVLVGRCNSLFLALQIAERPKVTSGLRTIVSNAVAGGAKKSAHLEGKACDFADIEGYLKRRITPELLKKHGLRMEHPKHTPTWLHLDIREPAGLIFIP